MKVFESSIELTKVLLSYKEQGQSIGFVPTMGALHQGHVSLVKRSVSDNIITVASIFVNPTQFNDKTDLANYPRTLTKDLDLLAANGCDFVFTPSEKEMYPQEDTRKFSFGSLEEVMEGKHRPGHFNGVAQIVSKLFAIVPADNAYFGEKDFQQVAIIKKMVDLLKLPVNIVPCPILRENDGLAMSSRNMLLTESQRKTAPIIYRTLLESVKKAGQVTVLELKEWVTDTINKNQDMQIEYFDIVNEATLQSIGAWSDEGNKVGCIAVKVGKIRLIDNIRYNI